MSAAPWILVAAYLVGARWAYRVSLRTAGLWSINRTPILVEQDGLDECIRSFRAPAAFTALVWPAGLIGLHLSFGEVAWHPSDLPDL